MEAGVAHVRSDDASTARFEIPFAPLADLTVAGLARHLARPWRIGLLVVRKGGFAVGHARGPEWVATKIGQRHVQGRSKAGGWSQQRFARRREQQAQIAYAAAAEHAVRLLAPHALDLDLLTTAGDRSAVDAVLATPKLTVLAARPQRWLPGIPDPKRDTLQRCLDLTRSVEITLTDPPT